jgi:hypothetical protein
MGVDPDSAVDSEVPSDGVVTIDFEQGDNCGASFVSPWWYNSYQCTDGKIDAQLVANALVFRKVGSSAAIDIRSTIKACKYGGDHCVSFIPPALDTGATYELVLPKGSIYSPIAGPTRSDFTIKLFGPFPFDLPFSRTLNNPQFASLADLFASRTRERMLSAMRRRAARSLRS